MVNISSKTVFRAVWNDARLPILEKLERLNIDIPLVCDEDALKNAKKCREAYGRKQQADN